MDALAQLTAAVAGRYRIERQIGAGGMATVHLARDLRHNRNVALKLLNPELGAVLGGERFLAEIQVTANLQHPNLLPLFDSGEAAGLLYYVMPYVDGESLRARLQREKQLPVDEAVSIATAVAGALDYAHAHGVIHRDLKPENVLLQAGQPVIADFGIALAVSKAGGARITQSGISLGTPQYMSPEQATGDRVVDGRTDIYSLGAIAYEMLAGEPPHTGTTAQAVIAKLLTEEVRPVAILRRNVPPQLDAVVRRALEKLPADRFPTGHDFVEALHGRAPAGAGAGTGMPRAATHAPVHNPLVLALGAAFAVASTAAIWAWAHIVREQPRQAVYLSIPIGPNTRLGQQSSRTVAISPDGRTIVFATADSSGRRKLFVRTLDGLETSAIPGTDGGYMPFFAPDGKTIGFVAGSQLRQVPIAGGTATPIADIEGLPSGASWGTSGMIVLSLGNRLTVVPSSGGLVRPIGGQDTSAVRELFPVVLANGRTALYTKWISPGIARARIAAVDLQSGHRTVFDSVQGTNPLGVMDGQLVYGRQDGTILAVPFDARRLRVSGTSAVVVSGVQAGGSYFPAKAALSGSGSLVYVAASGAERLVLADRRGVTPLSIPVGRFSHPRLSPDGRRIALQRAAGDRADIWVHESASGTLTRLTSEGTTSRWPEWSPDGRRVIFVSERGGPYPALWWQPWDGSAPAELLLGEAGKGVNEGVLTPDGRGLVYRIGNGPSIIKYRPREDDSATTLVGAPAFTQLAPRLSPDGRWVAYTSSESGTVEVYVRPLVGQGPRIQISVAGGWTPVWSRDGRFIYYPDADPQRLIAARVDLGPPFRIMSREIAYSGALDLSALGHAGFDVAPDGRFLLLQPAGEGEEIVVVHDWKFELRTRLTGRQQSP